MSVRENIAVFKQELETSGCALVAVSKTKPVELIKEAYEAGQLDFGENKVQELRAKPDQLPKDIRWHMIGHLQTNKVKYIAPFIYLIHAVDSFKLLKEINKQGLKNDRVINCLLQVHIAEESHKFGFEKQELIEVLESDELHMFQNIKIIGLMGMATYTDNQDQVSGEFKFLKKVFDEIKGKYALKNVEMKELSMGMSDDYPLAIEKGSTMIRVGSKIFGPRIHTK